MANQATLFDVPAEVGLERNHLAIPGLALYRGLLTSDEQKHVLRHIDAEPWRDDLKRRVQHYGYKYDYKAPSINREMRVRDLPLFAVEIARRMLDLQLVDEMPDQLIVNEYQPGQGISAHVDCEPCFMNTIVTISLGSVYEMDFIEISSGEVRSTPLELGSALVLRDAARYAWMHRIKARKSDGPVPRGRRVSLTYRNVILGE
jgi:alkylated DNA repair dioxygenase AlkB